MKELRKEGGFGFVNNYYRYQYVEKQESHAVLADSPLSMMTSKAVSDDGIGDPEQQQEAYDAMKQIIVANKVFQLSRQTNVEVLVPPPPPRSQQSTAATTRTTTTMPRSVYLSTLSSTCSRTALSFRSVSFAHL